MNLHQDEDTSTNNDMEINLFTVMAIRSRVGKECPDHSISEKTEFMKSKEQR